MEQTKPLKASRDLFMLACLSLSIEVPDKPSNALVESRSIVASRLIVRCGVPSEGENVYWDGISRLTIAVG
jgi:hypothetical protein